MKLVSISRATGSKKKPESFNFPNTAGIMSEKMSLHAVRRFSGGSPDGY